MKKIKGLIKQLYVANLEIVTPGGKRIKLPVNVWTMMGDLIDIALEPVIVHLDEEGNVAHIEVDEEKIVKEDEEAVTYMKATGKSLMRIIRDDTNKIVQANA